MVSHLENIKKNILEELEKAKTSISVASAYFTDDDLGLKLGEKATNGILVDLIISSATVNDPKEYLFSAMRQAGVNVYRTGAVDFTGGSVMHNKFCVIDHQTIITGSYNWTNQAARNEENIVVFTDAEQADMFLQKFYTLRDQGSIHAYGSGPDINLTVDKLLVEPGKPVKVTWKTSGADFIEVSHSGAVNENGETEILITHDETITLTAHADGRQKSKSVFVKVLRAPEVEFHASESSIIRTQTTQLQWSVKHAVSINITPGIGHVALQGKMDVNPFDSTTYTLTSVGAGGKETSKTISVHVFPTPIFTHIEIPIPEMVRLEVELIKSKTPLPSLLDLSTIDRVEFSFPKINGLDTKFIPNKPSLKYAKTDLHLDNSEIKQTLHETKKGLRSVTKRFLQSLIGK